MLLEVAGLLPVANVGLLLLEKGVSLLLVGFRPLLLEREELQLYLVGSRCLLLLDRCELLHVLADSEFLKLEGLGKLPNANDWESLAFESGRMPLLEAG